ncbi:flagellar hook protein FlgE [Cytobacillus gottheilii]|uniref:Flagellar hook protein FlgE n=1 Tax=Cytobacillus gottheilii TaxID=859144 RepID=A0ABX8FH13_9BACI|nr:flagellar hook-basal body complex protein [Cytobacillus gottheilii]QVY63296.1 flagellar hook-basal body complex protein [Cytobacillus gottheilii]
MLRSMYSGISGMKNFQTKLDVIGNNIANVNTYGFKKGRVTFKDTMNQTVAGASAAQENRGGKNAMQVGLGSTLATIDTIHTGSSLQTTGRSLDLGIDGDGYFVVSQGQSQYYTRAGNFYLDDNGTLVNADGLKVQSYENGVLSDITVNVNAMLPAVVTDEITLEGNLPSDASGANELVQQIKVVDANGDAQVLDLEFKGTGNNWTVQLWNRNVDPAQPSPATPQAITFPNQANSNIALSGFTPAQNVTLNFSGLTNQPGSITAMANPNGNTAGMLESFNIGSLGEINGVYSNGEIGTLGQLAIAKFSNGSGLLKAGNSLFQETVNSGVANINVAGEGRGVVAAGSLEMSNVDLSEEFTEMITAQRGFQSNTRIITTSDEILQELVNLKR